MRENSIGKPVWLTVLLLSSVQCLGQTPIPQLTTGVTDPYGENVTNDTDNQNSLTTPVLPEVVFLVDLACTNDGYLQDSLIDLATTLTAEGRYMMIKTMGHALTTFSSGDKDILAMLLERPARLVSNLMDTLVDVSVVIEPNAHLHVITDRSVEEYESYDLAFGVIMDKMIRVDVVSVDCTSQTGRRRRAVSAANFYQLIADASGGSVIRTDKNHIGAVVDIIKQTVTSSPVTILRFTLATGMMKKFRVPVDNTLTQVTIQLQTAKSSPAFVKQPSGIPERFAAGSGKLRQILGPLTVYKLNITSAADLGSWELMRLDAQEWDITVTGQSKVDFTYQLLEPGPGGYGEYPIKGRPILGQDLKIVISVPRYDRVKSVDNVLFLGRDNLPLLIQSLTNVGGRRGKSKFWAKITIPSDDFKVAVEGTDNTTVGHTFRRLDPQTVQPISIKLNVPSNAGILYVNETLDIPFTVSNEGSSIQDVDVKIEDNKKFAEQPDTIAASLKGGVNKTGAFTLRGGPTVGVTITVTITAKPFVIGSIRTGQYEVRRFTVQERVKKPNDTIDPTCNITNVIGTCNIGSDLCACVNETWTMEVQVSDVGFGLREIFPTGVASNKTFTHDTFTEGDLKTVKASVSADCCQQQAAINVVDKAGNIGQCQLNISQNFNPPDPKICNNSTSLNLTIPCKNVVMTGKCDFGTNPCDCHNKGWHAQLEFGTVGWALYQAFTLGAGNNASLVRNNNTVELDMDCCHQQLTINALDMAGNVGQCHAILNKSFKTPTPSDCTTTTSTTTPTTTTTTTTTTTAAATSASTTNTASSKLTASTKPGVSATTKPSGGSTGTKPVAGATTPKAKAAGAATGASGAGAITLKTAAGASAAGGTTNSASTTTASAAATNTDNNNSSDDSKYIKVPREAVGATITIAAVLAIGGVVTMGVLFRKALKKKGSVTPQHRNQAGRQTPDAW